MANKSWVNVHFDQHIGSGGTYDPDYTPLYKADASYRYCILDPNTNKPTPIGHASHLDLESEEHNLFKGLSYIPYIDDKGEKIFPWAEEETYTQYTIGTSETPLKLVKPGTLPTFANKYALWGDLPVDGGVWCIAWRGFLNGEDSNLTNISIKRNSTSVTFTNTFIYKMEANQTDTLPTSTANPFADKAVPTRFLILLQGAGGGGGGADFGFGGQSAAGGGAGAFWFGVVKCEPGWTIKIELGKGGNGGASNPNDIAANTGRKGKDSFLWVYDNNNNLQATITVGGGDGGMGGESPDTRTDPDTGENRNYEGKGSVGGGQGVVKVDGEKVSVWTILDSGQKDVKSNGLAFFNGRNGTGGTRVQAGTHHEGTTLYPGPIEYWKNPALTTIYFHGQPGGGTGQYGGGGGASLFAAGGNGGRGLGEGHDGKNAIRGAGGGGGGAGGHWAPASGAGGKGGDACVIIW